MKRKSPEEKYNQNLRFIEKVHKTGLPSREISEDVQLKIAYLRSFGYTHLKSEGGRSRLEGCSDGRLTLVFFKLYEEAQKQVFDFEQSVRDENPLYRGIAKLIERESRVPKSDDELGERVGIMLDSANPFVLRLLSRKYGQRVLGEYFTP
jgi:hypothetical protein